MYMYVYAHTHTRTHARRQTDRQTDAQTQTDTALTDTMHVFYPYMGQTPPARAPPCAEGGSRGGSSGSTHRCAQRPGGGSGFEPNSQVNTRTQQLRKDRRSVFYMTGQSRVNCFAYNIGNAQYRTVP